MISQIADNLRMEKQIVIHNGVIKELQVRLKSVETVNTFEEEKDALEREVDKLVSDVEQLQKENNEKIHMLEHMKDESEILREKFKLDQEKEYLQNFGENLDLSEELGLVGIFSSLFFCESCDESFESQNNVKSHKNEHHKEQIVKNILKKKVNVLGETKVCFVFQLVRAEGKGGKEKTYLPMQGLL